MRTYNCPSRLSATIDKIKSNPVLSQNAVAIAVLEAARSAKFEFCGLVGGAADPDCGRGFGPTGQRWQSEDGSVVILDDNCFPMQLYVVVGGRKLKPVIIESLATGETRAGWCEWPEDARFNSPQMIHCEE